MRAWVAASMPAPLSLTASITYLPGVAGKWPRTYSSSNSASPVSMRSFPPPGMASRALTARFMMICCS